MGRPHWRSGPARVCFKGDQHSGGFHGGRSVRDLDGHFSVAQADLAYNMNRALWLHKNTDLLPDPALMPIVVGLQHASITTKVSSGTVILRLFYITNRVNKEFFEISSLHERILRLTYAN